MVKLISACVPAIILGVIFHVLPVLYENNDDPGIALILQGENTLEMTPDPHGLFVHYFVGWIVSSLSTRFPRVAWYGLLMTSLYILAYTVIGCNLPGKKYGSSVG